ncbi:MAG: ribose-phosphate pyrophosphokinase-like domain-containing protein, partial [Clostridiales bacterium]|nr:ribose-phosphate pyrophosphokinase-like domain-containing protein [Clostridiales bacterium]
MDSRYYGDLGVIGMKGTEAFVQRVDAYLKQWRPDDSRETYLMQADCPRFGTGEAKGLVRETCRGRDIFIFSDMYNYGVTYKMYGMNVPMSPDDHYQDLKRIIGA